MKTAEEFKELIDEVVSVDVSIDENRKQLIDVKEELNEAYKGVNKISDLLTGQKQIKSHLKEKIASHKKTLEPLNNRFIKGKTDTLEL